MQKRNVLYAERKYVPQKQEFVDRIFFKFSGLFRRLKMNCADEQAVSKVAKEV